MMITQELINRILLIPYVFIGINLIAGLITFQRQDRVQRLIFILIVVTAITELLSKILWYQKLNNLSVFHIYAVIEFSIIVLVYEVAYKNNHSRFSLFRLAIYLMAIFAILNAIFLQKLVEFNSNVITISALILTFFRCFISIKY